MNFLEQLRNNPTMQLWSGLPHGRLLGSEWSRDWSVSFTQDVQGHEWGQRRAVSSDFYGLPYSRYFSHYLIQSPNILWIEWGIGVPQGHISWGRGSHNPVCLTPNATVPMLQLRWNTRECGPAPPPWVWEGSFFLPSLSPAGRWVIPTRCSDRKMCTGESTEDRAVLSPEEKKVGETLSCVWLLKRNEFHPKDSGEEGFQHRTVGPQAHRFMFVVLCVIGES